MKELTLDLWSLDVDAICITTNGYIKTNGDGVMGRGCALEAVQRRRNAPMLLGEHLRTKGNHVGILYHEGPKAIVAFPVKHIWKQPADIHLIERSARELRDLTDFHHWKSVAIGRPGCGNGRLSWNEVRPVIAEYFDERFIVVSK